MSGSATPADSVVIERLVDAPVDVVWQMWTDPGHFANWYGPNGATIPVVQFDVRVGGIRRVCMEMNTPNGTMARWFTGEHLVVATMERLVYTEAMCDKDGNVLSPTEIGMPDRHPATTEVHVDIESVDGQTKMRMTHVGIPADSPGATGWTMAFDKLAAYLKSSD